MNSALSYIGHSTLLLELADARVLTDPVLGRGIAHIRRTAPSPRLEDLAALDAVLVSHAHQDHLDPPSLRLVARGKEQDLMETARESVTGRVIEKKPEI